jgi:hypothetical protein
MNPTAQTNPSIRNTHFFQASPLQSIFTCAVLLGSAAIASADTKLKEAYAPSGVDALYVKNVIVNGDVQAEKSSGRLRVSANQIDGNLQFVENRRGPYVISYNRVRGDLQFFKNQGRGSIHGNVVKGNLQSKENSPRPLIKNNLVEGDAEVE